MRALQGQARASGRFWAPPRQESHAGRHFSTRQSRRAAMLCGSAVLLLTVAAGPIRSWGSEPDKSSSPAAQFVRQALEAEAAGDTAGRARYLAKALAADPEYAPAHWQLGEVRRGDQWVEPVELAHDTKRVSQIDEYRKLRDKSKDAIADQQKLAHFAGNAGLVEQERLHFENLYRLSPDSAEARERLGLMPYQGTFVSPQQKVALEAEARRAQVSTTEWVPKLVALRKDIMTGQPAARTKAIEELQSIREPTAIPALEAATKLSSAEVGRAVAASLSQIRDQAATDSLVRHAVLAQDAKTRNTAVDALRSRSLYAYVPMLLSYMQLPIQSRYETFFLDDGRPAHRLSLFQEGKASSLSFVSEGAASAVINVDPQGRQVGFAGIRDASMPADLDLSSNVHRFNVMQNATNQRAADVLRAVMDESLPAAPKAWWEWWANQNELYGPSEKPVSYITRTSGESPVEYQVRYHSCFVPGTLVWTCTGPLAIEEVKVGEIVLAKNVETGELAYKPVTATTVGPKLPLVEITAGGETIRCTYGHLFWVSGVGWKMAKELEPGQWLHTTNGAVLIDNIEKKGKASCHNLIVADFNTYFVTDQAFLVHDINVRGPTTATVPGLIDESEGVALTPPP